MRLTDLHINETAMITEQDMDRLPAKLVDFGCVPGNVVTVVNYAPFNGPVYLKVQETYFAVRKEVADFIDVVRFEEKEVA
ncbi:MAG: ferrous iron transport protein A [Flavobacteriales bacterium]|nr:ferrous iron transport protein A [Flavobacteriales bacterium]